MKIGGDRGRGGEGGGCRVRTPPPHLECLVNSQGHPLATQELPRWVYLRPRSKEQQRQEVFRTKFWFVVFSDYRTNIYFFISLFLFFVFSFSASSLPPSPSPLLTDAEKMSNPDRRSKMAAKAIAHLALQLPPRAAG